MSKRGSTSVSSSKAPRPSKPSGSKSVELPRSIRPAHLKSSSVHERSSAHNSKATPSTKLARSDDDNNNTPSSPHTSARESEPATDEETQFGSSLADTTEPPDFGSHFQLDTAERQAFAMLNKITKKSERNHQKYDALRGNISGKDKQVDELHASFEDLVRQTAGLEVLCNSVVDSDTMEKLFMTLPFQQRQLYVGK